MDIVPVQFLIGVIIGVELFVGIINNTAVVFENILISENFTENFRSLFYDGSIWNDINNT